MGDVVVVVVIASSSWSRITLACTLVLRQMWNCGGWGDNLSWDGLIESWGTKVDIGFSALIECLLRYVPA